MDCNQVQVMHELTMAGAPRMSKFHLVIRELIRLEHGVDARIRHRVVLQLAMDVFFDGLLVCRAETADRIVSPECSGQHCANYML